MLSHFSHVRLYATPWTVALQDPLSMGILQVRILEWTDISFFGDLPNPRIETESLASPALAGRFFTTSPTWKAPSKEYIKHLNILQTAMQDSLWYKMFCQKSLKDCQSQIHMCPPQSFWYQLWSFHHSGIMRFLRENEIFLVHLWISSVCHSVFRGVKQRRGCSYLLHQARRFSVSSTLSLEAYQYSWEDLGALYLLPHQMRLPDAETSVQERLPDWDMRSESQIKSSSPSSCLGGKRACWEWCPDESKVEGTRRVQPQDPGPPAAGQKWS